VIRAALAAIGLLGLAAGIAARRRPAIADGSSGEIVSAIDGAHRLRLEVGVAPDLQGLVAARPPSQHEWEDALAVYVAPAGSGPPVAGAYRVSSGRVVFEPLFPLVPGLAYEAVVQLDRLRQAAGPASGPTGRVVRRIVVPAPTGTRRTVVAAVYPTTGRVPANLLRMYVEFSGPMREGEAARHVSLVDDQGRRLPGAFLALRQELWDSSHRRLTLLLDPGRIKRGLRPNQELGAPLLAGRRYQLRIDAGWRDAQGTPLVSGFETAWTAGAPERRALDPAAWSIAAPCAGTTGAIVVRSPVPLDHALARRLVRVTDRASVPVPVTVELEDAGRTVRIVPARVWRSGAYHLLFPAELEDVAGNRPGRAFDVDLAHARRGDRQEAAVTRTLALH
jgi:hypothetical protein